MSQNSESEPSRSRGFGRSLGNFQFKVIAINRPSGKILWERIASEASPHEGHHNTNSFASASAVTDGVHLFAYFGSRGVYCYDLEGNLKWEADLGNMRKRNGHGEGSSPSLSGDTLVINWDHEGASFIVALNKLTGKERWRKERREVTTWATPLIVEQNGASQVIVPGTRQITGYDIATGKTVWTCSGGLGTNPIPSPVYADGLVYVTSGYRSPAMLAIRISDAKGDITNTDAVVWSIHRDTPYVSSPLLYGDRLYLLKSDQAILSCLDARTGKAFYGPQRLRGVYASPVGVQDRVYITGLNGTTAVVKHDTEFQVLALNELSERISASPVVIGDEIFLRGTDHLYCIAEE